MSSIAPASAPTVAETGVPVSAGTDGPGPKSGSLRDLRTDSPNVGLGVQQSLPGENVANAPRTEPTASASSDGSTAQVEPAVAAADKTHDTSTFRHESAEEEKKRLAQEERERMLNSGTGGNESTKKDGSEDPPPEYQDF